MIDVKETSWSGNLGRAGFDSLVIYYILVNSKERRGLQHGLLSPCDDRLIGKKEPKEYIEKMKWVERKSW